MVEEDKVTIFSVCIRLPGVRCNLLTGQVEYNRKVIRSNYFRRLTPTEKMFHASREVVFLFVYPLRPLRIPLRPLREKLLRWHSSL
jgi:hypothetical protein